MITHSRQCVSVKLPMKNNRYDLSILLHKRSGFYHNVPVFRNFQLFNIMI